MKAQCPACRKIAHLPETEAGLSAVCSACGAMYLAPMSPFSKGTEPPSPKVETPAEPELSAEKPKPTVAAFWGIVATCGCVAAVLVTWGAIQWRASHRGSQPSQRVVEQASMVRPLQVPSPIPKQVSHPQ